MIGGGRAGLRARDRAAPYRASYGMMVRAFAGLSREEVDALAERTITRGSHSPSARAGASAAREIDDFVRVQEPMRALAARLRAEGVDVWVVSASFEPIVVAFARRIGIDADHVIGARLVGARMASTRRPSLREHARALIPLRRGQALGSATRSSA